MRELSPIGGLGARSTGDARRFGTPPGGMGKNRLEEGLFSGFRQKLP